VVSELVINAADHARTVMTLQLKLGWQYLHIAVFDGVRAEPVLSHDQQPDIRRAPGWYWCNPSHGGGDLALRDDGKVVWAALADHRLTALSRSQVGCR
jgi:hypothetical protein